MAAPSIGMKDIFVAAGLGSYEDPSPKAKWPIYISKLPDEPAECISIADTGGLPPEVRWLLNYPDVTVYVRGKEYGRTYDKINQLRESVLALPAQEVNGDWWDGVIQLTEIAFLEYDKARNRPIFSMTFRLFVEPKGTHKDNRRPL